MRLDQHDPATMVAGGGPPGKYGWMVDELEGKMPSTSACWIGSIGIESSGSLTQMILVASSSFLSGPRAHWSEVVIL